MKLATLSSFVLFTSLVQARVCTTSENLTCGIAPICMSEYKVSCSDGSSKSFSAITGPLGLGKGAYPEAKKWAVSEGLTEKKFDKRLTFFIDSSERPDARYCVTELFNSQKSGIDGKTVLLHNIYVTCPSDSTKSKLAKLVTREAVQADLENMGYKNITSDKDAKIQIYRHSAD